MPRYFEIIVTGRQLAAVVAAVAVLVLVAFGLGVGVRALQPRAERPPQPPLTLAAAPTPVAEPTPPPPTTVPTPLPTPPPQPTATAAPAHTPTARAAAAAPTRAPAGRWVQVAALAKHDQAEGVRTRIVALGYTQKQVVVQAAEGKFRVRVGPFPDVESAGRVAARLRAEGFAGTFVVSE